MQKELPPRLTSGELEILAALWRTGDVIAGVQFIDGLKPQTAAA